MSTPAPTRRAIAHSLLRPLQFRDTGGFAQFEHLFGGGGGEQMHYTSNNSGPSGLMVGAEASSVVALEVLVEQDEISPMAIFLKLPVPPVHRPPSVLVPEKNIGQPMRKLLSDLI